MNKLKEELKDKPAEVPSEYRELKVTNDKLKDETARLTENYNREVER